MGWHAEFEMGSGSVSCLWSEYMVQKSVVELRVQTVHADVPAVQLQKSLIRYTVLNLDERVG